MKYYYNEQENSFFIACNFIPKETPKNFVEITKEQYEEMNKQDNQNNEEKE